MEAPSPVTPGNNINFDGIADIDGGGDGKMDDLDESALSFI